MTEWALLTSAVVLSTFLTWLFLRYAIAQQVVDIPNERSSHALATPRGGGIAIAITFIGCLLTLRITGIISTELLAAFAGSGIVVALIGIIDDHRPVASSLRLLVHFVAAAWILFCLASALQQFPTRSILPLWSTNLVAAFYLVWLTNLYNFMDGIDGLASIEAITVGIGGAVLYWLILPEGLWLLPALLVASASGFLIWNFPPARIFMGDCGSGFLGISFAVLSLHAATFGQEVFWAWTVLLAVFVVDATSTLLLRALKGEKIFHAHRSHAYQHATRKLDSHRIVSLVVGAINLFWLVPIALLIGMRSLNPSVAVPVAYLPLIFLHLYCRKSSPESK